MSRPEYRRNVRLWVAGTGISVAGDAALSVALSVWVKELTGSNGQAGLAFLAFLAPRLLTPFTAVLADRLRRRPLVVVLNLLLAAWVSLALLVDGPAGVPLLYLVLFGVGLGTGLHHAAGTALLTRLVPAERLGATNAVLRTAQEVGLLVAPAVGTALYVAFGARAVAALDAATFVLCAALVAAVRVHEPRPEPRRGSRWAELTAGLVHVAGTAGIRRVVLAMGGALLVFGFFESIVFAVVDEGLHRPAAFLGVLATVKGAGSVAGGLLAVRIVRGLPAGGEARLTVLGLGLLGLGSAVMLLPAVPAVLAGAAVVGLGIPMAIVGLFTVAQQHTPPHLQGRVAGAAGTLVTAPQVASVAVGAVLIGWVDFRVLLAVVAATVLLAAGCLAARTRTGRAADTGVLPEDLPTKVS
ncbi:MFS transporter [Amorphoplanes digitatis]|uniref:MFS family permease n=1 Tax=Actinoplanes digitatis TaxID=1868 RepID=A0A7W7MPS7_9ACTN|nr:MFS transporter [Actinoplanes digitatis]MBB4761840.1 MFS family permease [Actinoplanes digitatis]GID90951.1 MFS transporter [Actinoplanes digitatis]